ncbi:cob(I)yrinic acid a,c-diamide adenosyltransferase [Candidatus Nitrospira allomarina]|jgi:cob(I)alamin adenosyltransferase|uniref:Corrinoid adenosyltransferase n=1 Tax=Candidatus Nitrospira allomarina TaxID=3020900 RepID=A0AA96JR50_9BACT|nr:cob(I)yrinic acid a,c-diamide adenosyltransferase [Candidatus Nitrospira allomarina]WNM56728.1 cob(I)yrinic acid a,c-diamide adenosyltransferase [Candidatus Nitrospira allomarina]
MRISKVYTRTGDAGKTRLAGGQEVWKDSVRVEAYGTVDELNSMLGLARVANGQAGTNVEVSERMGTILKWVQNKLFDLGGILATAQGESFPNMPTVTSEDVAHLEHLIDECQKDLTPLKEFILPGGGQLAALLHVARTIGRRAERLCVTLSKEESIDKELVIFLNRLSDALFVFARWVSKKQGEAEFLWEREPATSQKT